MSHVRPDGKPVRGRFSDCKKGRHRYGAAQYIGAGIERRVCDTCGAVTIDLTSVDDNEGTPLVETRRTMQAAAGPEPEDSS